MKKSFLSIALIASLALVGCGGGGGSSSPTAPAVVVPNEALVAGSIVSPIANNANTILDYTPAAASYRLSTNNSDNFSFDNISDNVQIALKAPVIARATLRAATMAGQFDNSKKFEEVTTFENNVFERKVYKDIETSKNNPNDYLLYFKIENCDGNLNNDGILTKLTIGKDAPITIDDIKGGVKLTGNLTTDLSLIAAPNVSEISGIVDYDGIAIEEGEGYRYSKKITVTNLFAISNINLNLSSLEVKDDFDYEHNTYTGITKGTNVKLSISGLDGTSLQDEKTIYSGGEYVKKQDGQWVTNSNNKSSKLVVTDNRDISYLLKTPVEIAVSGNISDTDTETNTTDSFTANNVSLKITELVEDDSTYGYRIEKGEAHVDVSSVSISEKLMIGNHEVAFDKAKIDITNLKYDDAWKSLTKSERRINIFKNAVVNISTEETKNKVSLTAKYVVADNKITATLTNNGSFIVKDKDNLLQFNFDKVDVTATNVKYVEQDSFEGSYIMVKGTERDGTLSERTYSVQNQKLVLQNANDKQLVTIPNELDKTASEIADEIKAVESNLVQSSTNPNLKIAVNNTGIKLATYQQEAVGENKKIDTKIMAKDNVICAVSYYGDDVYTVVFALDNSNPNMQIKGKNTSATLDTTTGLIGTFTGSNSKINVVTNDGNSYDVAL